MYFISPDQKFPPVELADEDGFLAVTRELSIDRILEAYHLGIFPWYSEGQPVLWWSPDPRMVLFPEELKVSKSMRPYLNQNKFQITFNQDFEAVIDHCGKVFRKGQDGTWITPEIKRSYLELHRMGIAISAEVWDDHTLVGGLYGIYLREKKLFCGESMFANVSNASKFGFIKMVRKLQEEGIQLIDCQVYTDHLASLGAREIPREEFFGYLK
ncbi:leucyl/phenylalanyl-tRNA--protein transferase [Christiangramia sp. OXR-203]|uniref:leucyl/phenylalanyl-tRNA--protein transferase n=1 Tax=Christiangramia sp. OXR-203 TaxID=3100176 RepID=UPI002AC93F5E|nr:leucyl/phenylalanyl-tRNA--protein transferase [Christiangramia sp. OXR-203]WPY98972.1 leucyl/phenylalanyl-tRNA--protein transferase [Christiangramia sp. OXR-203]